MPVSELRLIKRCAEWRPREEYLQIPEGTRGIYTLLKKKGGSKRFDVGYVGLSAGTIQGIKRRLRSHANSKRKRRHWDHFSLFEVHDNITEAEIAELEGLFRHIYRRDSRANKINKQRRFKKLVKKNVRVNDLTKW
jgi:hypothetical protein